MSVRFGPIEACRRWLTPRRLARRSRWLLLDARRAQAAAADVATVLRDAGVPDPRLGDFLRHVPDYLPHT